MSEWQNKIWGTTRELVNSIFYSKYELNINVGSYCSLHYHRERANKFHVISGMVAIVEMFGPDCNRIILRPDNTYIVPSLVPHMFIVYKSGVMFEEYFPDRGGTVKNDDIVRIVEGGRSDISLLDMLPHSLF